MATSIHYQRLSKESTAWITDFNNLSLLSLQVLLLLFIDKHDDFANKTRGIKKVLATINGIPGQLFVADLQARYI